MMHTSLICLFTCVEILQNSSSYSSSSSDSEEITYYQNNEVYNSNNVPFIWYFV